MLRGIIHAKHAEYLVTFKVFTLPPPVRLPPPLLLWWLLVLTLLLSDAVTFHPCYRVARGCCIVGWSCGCRGRLHVL